MVVTGCLSQFYLRLTEADKFLVLYALLRLQLIPGKALIFVNKLDVCYRLKLFLGAFSINAAVLNSEVPSNSRRHILEQFNKVLLLLCVITTLSYRECSII